MHTRGGNGRRRAWRVAGWLLCTMASACTLSAAREAPGIMQPPLGTDAMRRLAINQPQAMIERARQQLDRAPESTDPAHARGLLWWMGSAALNLNNDATLTEAVLRLDSLDHAHKDDLAAAAADFLRAFHAILNGDASGLSLALRGAARVQDTHDPRVDAWARYELCDAYTQVSEPAKAMPLCRAAATAARRVGDAWELADDENDLAWNLSALHHYQRAVKLFLQSRQRFHSIGADQVAAQIGDNLAHTYILLGRPREALQLSKASLVHEQANGRESDALLSRANIARAWAALGRPQHAEQLMRGVIADARRTSNHGLLPHLYAADSRFAEAAGHLKRALHSARKVSELLRNQRRPSALAAEATLERRYSARERELRIHALEHENRVKSMALTVAQTQAARQAEAERRQRLQTIAVAIAAIALLAIATLLILLLRNQRRHARALRHQALRDPLTGIDNRRAFMIAAQAMIAERRAKGARAHALLLIDLDHFKHVNDTAGHPAGDRVLAEVVAYLDRACRPVGRVSRLGGEEFAVLCANLGAEDARLHADTLRAGVAALPLSLHEDLRLPRVTVSIGVALFDGVHCHDIDSWMQAADKALYSAKARGRNTVVVAHPAAADGLPA
jgi:diguanylate cyclase (GGDEF)-like protein